MRSKALVVAVLGVAIFLGLGVSDVQGKFFEAQFLLKKGYDLEDLSPLSFWVGLEEKGYNTTWVQVEKFQQFVHSLKKDGASTVYWWSTMSEFSDVEFFYYAKFNGYQVTATYYKKITPRQIGGS